MQRSKAKNCTFHGGSMLTLIMHDLCYHIPWIWMCCFYLWGNKNPTEIIYAFWRLYRPKYGSYSTNHKWVNFNVSWNVTLVWNVLECWTPLSAPTLITGQVVFPIRLSSSVLYYLVGDSFYEQAVISPQMMEWTHPCTNIALTINHHYLSPIQSQYKSWITTCAETHLCLITF